jgi:PAS domain S-box-containing protein
VTASRVWTEIVGRSALEAPGYRWTEYVHEEHQDRVEEVLAAIKARRDYVTAFRVRHHRGHYVWVHSGGRPQADGGYLGWTRIATGDLRPLRRIAQAVCYLALVVVV